MDGKKKKDESAAEILDVSAPLKKKAFANLFSAEVDFDRSLAGMRSLDAAATAVKIILPSTSCLPRSSSHSHRTAAARALGLHVPHHPAQHQLHRRGRTGHPAGNPVPRQPLHVDRDSRCGLAHLQGVAPGTGHGVPHQCPAHPAWRGRHGGPGAAAHQQDQVCR